MGRNVPRKIPQPRRDENEPIEPLSGEKGPTMDAPIVPSTMRNPSMFGQSTESQQNPSDDLDVAFGAIRYARERGDVDGARRAWLDLGALLGSAQDAPASSAKRQRKRSA